MKIVYLYEGLPAYRKDFFCLLNERLKEKGYTLKVLYGKKEKNESLQLENNLGFEAESFPVKLLFKKGALRVVSFPGIVKQLKREKPDVYVLQFHVSTISYWWLYIYSKIHHVPYITWDCNYLKPELGRNTVTLRTYLTNMVYKNACVCLSYGTKFRNSLLEIGKKDNEVIVSQNTINIERIISERSETCNERKYDHPIKFLYVGVVDSRKYLESAIEAISQLVNDGKDIYFDVVGGGDSYDICQTLIKKLGMASRIVMHGPKHGKDVQKFFENADVFILPGTGGLAVNEAMAYSLPIISTEGDGTIIDLVDGNGFLLNKLGDVDEIKGAMQTFLNLSPKEKEAMSKRSEEIIVSRASLSNMVNKHIEAIERSFI